MALSWHHTNHAPCWRIVDSKRKSPSVLQGFFASVQPTFPSFKPQACHTPAHFVERIFMLHLKWHSCNRHFMRNASCRCRSTVSLISSLPCMSQSTCILQITPFATTSLRACMDIAINIASLTSSNLSFGHIALQQIVHLNQSSVSGLSINLLALADSGMASMHVSGSGMPTSCRGFCYSQRSCSRSSTF